MIPFLVTPDMVMSFPLYISSFQKVRFYFKTEVEDNVLGSWTHEHVQPQKYQALKRLLGIWSWKSQVSSFCGLLLNFLVELLKARLPKQNKTKK